MRGANPYYANEGRYAGVGQAVGNLGQLFVDATDPSRAAQADALGWQARGNREEVIDMQRARVARDDLSQQFLEMDPNTYDPRQTLATAVGGNVYDPGEIGDLFRVATANVPGFDDNRLARAVVGAGGDIGVDDAFSLPGQQNIANRNFGYDMAQDAQSQAADYAKAIDLQDRKPLSRDQSIARLFTQGGVEAAQEGVRGMYAPSANAGTRQAIQYQLSDGTTATGLFDNKGGYLDNQGQPMNMDNVASVARIGQPQGSNEDLGLTTGATTALQKNDVELANVDDMVGLARGVAQDERNFGISGGVRRTVQDAIQQGDALAATLNKQASSIQEDIVTTGGNVGLDAFDPNISQLDMIKNMLAYQVAKLNDPSGRVSDRDFLAAKESLGFGRMLTNQADFLARLDLLERISGGQQERIGGRLGAGAQPPATSTGQDLGALFNEGADVGQGGDLQPGTPYVDEDTGEQYEFVGGDPSDPTSWQRVR